MALWEIKLSLEARAESGTRAKTVLVREDTAGRNETEMFWGDYQNPTLSLALLKVDKTSREH